MFNWLKRLGGKVETHSITNDLIAEMRGGVSAAAGVKVNESTSLNLSIVYAGDGGVIKNITAQNGEPDSLESWALFHETVDQLPEEEREIFQLVWYGGLQQQEIATLLDVSVPTVQRRLYRARRIIGSELQQPPAEEN